MRGFSEAEKSMLTSTFRLTSRRAMAYVEPEAGDVRADIYLINADNPDAWKNYRDVILACRMHILRQ